jgi:hypothetical protein
VRLLNLSLLPPHLRNSKILRHCAFILRRLRYDEQERKSEVKQKNDREAAQEKMTDEQNALHEIIYSAEHSLQESR